MSYILVALIIINGTLFAQEALLKLSNADLSPIDAKSYAARTVQFIKKTNKCTGNLYNFTHFI